MMMMENKIGRPSKAQERSYEILQAAVSVVAREGLEGITFAKVAEASGKQRSNTLNRARYSFSLGI